MWVVDSADCQIFLTVSVFHCWWNWARQMSNILLCIVDHVNVWYTVLCIYTCQRLVTVNGLLGRFMHCLLALLQSDWSNRSYFSFESSRCISRLLSSAIQVLPVNSEWFMAHVINVLLVFTALHGMQTRSSDENSVCPSVRPSVRPSHACIVTKRKKDLSKFLHHTKDNLA